MSQRLDYASPERSRPSNVGIVALYCSVSGAACFLVWIVFVCLEPNPPQQLVGTFVFFSLLGSFAGALLGIVSFFLRSARRWPSILSLIISLCYWLSLVVMWYIAIND